MSTENAALKEDNIIYLMKSFLEFPAQTICKHYCVIKILSELEKNGLNLNKDFLKAVAESDDTAALSMIDNGTALADDVPKFTMK